MKFPKKRKKKKEMPLLQILQNPILSYYQNPKPNPKSLKKPTHFLQFNTSDSRNLHYLKNLGIITSTSPAPPPETIHWILDIVNFLKSKSFANSDFARLSFLEPSIFSSSDIDRTLKPIFCFLYNDLLASPQQARGLILRCPNLLSTSATYRLQPTFQFLCQLGIENLNAPTNLNAHLLNTPIEKLVSKIEFLEDWGLRREEAMEICRRLPAIFGYSVEHNLRPKAEYLVYEMRREVEEVAKFPQYFAFSLERRIAPRHLHLKERDARISLKKMLLWSDDKFYGKWK